MVRLTLLEKIGYREWTETLGEDREWIIQISQARFYASMQEYVSKLHAYAVPLRYDYQLLISTGIDKERHLGILDHARASTTLPLRLVSVADDVPKRALDRAYHALRNTGSGELSFMEGHDGLTAIAHVDINGISATTQKMGLTESLSLINELVYEVSRVSLKHGGIAQYLGGDNILVILPDHGYEALVEEIASNTSLKVGVGISFRPRTAVMLATKALDQIRSGYVENNINVLTG